MSARFLPCSPTVSRRLATIALALFATVCDAGPLQRYVVGDVAAPTPGPVSAGLLLLGGGDRSQDALRWFFAKAGHGHVVVLRASLAGEIGEEFHRDIGGIASAETFVFSDRAQSEDPTMLAALARADAIFVAGGDQARYVRFWQGTPVARALDAHVAAGKPLGGTSAGLAILGEKLYGAMDGGSITSPEALADPFGPATTIVSDFLHLELLRGVLTDTHFKERDRLGRLFAFLAVAQRDRPRDAPAMCGLGVDEDAAVAVEPDGRARVYGAAPDAGAWIVHGDPLRGAGVRTGPGGKRSLDGVRVPVTVAGRESVLRLPACTVERPLRERTYLVQRGRAIEAGAPRR